LNSETAKILEAVPYDDWISAKDIALKIGGRSIHIAWAIKNKLLFKHVERKHTSDNLTTPYKYRRLKRVGMLNFKKYQS